MRNFSNETEIRKRRKAVRKVILKRYVSIVCILILSYIIGNFMGTFLGSKNPIINTVFGYITIIIILFIGCLIICFAIIGSAIIGSIALYLKEGKLFKDLKRLYTTIINTPKKMYQNEKERFKDAVEREMK